LKTPALAAVASTWCMVLPVLGQPCEGGWSPFPGTSSNDQLGIVYCATQFDFDGSPDTPGQLVIGGTFASISNAPVSGAARWNGATWEEVGPRGDRFGDLMALCVHDEDGTGPGAACLFGADQLGVVRWGPGGWVRVGTFNTQDGRRVKSLYSVPTSIAGPISGKLMAGGDFDAVSGQTARGLAVWDGESWSEAFGGVTTNTPTLRASVNAFLTMPDTAGLDRLVFAGTFDNVGSQLMGPVAAWTPSGVVPLRGSGSTTQGWLNGRVYSLCTFDFDGVGPESPKLVAGGQLYAGWTPSSQGVVALDEAGWFPISPTINGQFVRTVYEWREPGTDEPRLVVAGPFSSIGNVEAVGAAWFDGSWHSFPGLFAAGEPTVFAIGTMNVDAAGVRPESLFMLGDFPIGTSRALALWEPSNRVQIQQGPPDLRVGPGSPAVLSVTAQAGSASLQYRWSRGGVVLAEAPPYTGTATAELQVSSVVAAVQGDYSCEVWDACGGIRTEAAQVSCRPLLVEQPPGFVVLAAGVQLAVQIPAGESATYRWRQDGQNLFNIPGLFSGVTTRTLRITGIDPSVAGTYDCLVTNSCGQTTSNTSVVYCPSDANRDRSVDGDDVILFFQQWDQNDEAADFTGDGAVDGDDVIGFFGRWDVGC
jgi:hypothetical protein